MNGDSLKLKPYKHVNCILTANKALTAINCRNLLNLRNKTELLPIVLKGYSKELGGYEV